MIGHSSQVCNVAIMLSRYQSDNPSSRTEEDCPVYDVPDHAQPMCSGINTCCRPLAGGLHLALWYQIPVSLSCGSNVTGITQQRTVRFLLNCDIRRYITHAAGGTPRSPPAPGQSSALRQGGGGEEAGGRGSLKERWWSSEKIACGGCARSSKHAPSQRLSKGSSSLTPHTISHFPYLVHQSDGHAPLIHQELEEVPTKVLAQRITGLTGLG